MPKKLTILIFLTFKYLFGDIPKYGKLMYYEDLRKFWAKSKNLLGPHPPPSTVVQNKKLQGWKKIAIKLKFNNFF